MKNTKGTKTQLFSIMIVSIFLAVSFTSTVAFQAVRSTPQATTSPLFQGRLHRIITNEQTFSLSRSYLGKNIPIDIPLPSRDILTKETLDQLLSPTITAYLRALDPAILQTWDNILTIAQNNILEINKIIRQEYTTYQQLFTEFSDLSTEQATTLFLENIRSVDLSDDYVYPAGAASQLPIQNITSGFFCNITSGQFCQITSQPICQITTQPICSLTKGFFCWTIYGPICPTTGIKCHPPTSRPTLCSIFAAAGKLLKTVLVVLLLAVVIFVPLGILSLAIITVFAPDRCEQIHERVTIWFNCTTPQK
jgi:hypothetical protein